MIAAFDSYYFEDKVRAACILFERWRDSLEKDSYSIVLPHPEPYVPGSFYKRELPGMLELYEMLPDKEHIETLLVDAFVYLDDEYKLGLGGLLYVELDKKIPVIGLAKSNFSTVHRLKSAIFRGKSHQPLFVSSIGIPLTNAVKKVKNMHGTYRIPTLLKRLDHVSRGIV